MTLRHGDKAAQRGKTVVVVSRWYPSCKTCSACGYTIPKLPLPVREWTYPQCHAHLDRDINAAINLQTRPRVFGWRLLTRSGVTGTAR